MKPNKPNNSRKQSLPRTPLGHVFRDESRDKPVSDDSSSSVSLFRYARNRKKTGKDDIAVFPGYSAKVLVTNWFNPKQSYPKNYDAYNPPGGNYFRSSYDRWGTSEGRMISELQAMQESCMTEMKKPKPRHDPPLFNLVTLGAVNMNDFLTEDSELQSKPTGYYDDLYTTTSQRDYVNHYPEEPKMFDRAKLQKPETKFRNLLTELAHPRRPGRNKFFDENLEYLNAKTKNVGVSRPPWALQFDPGTCGLEVPKDQKKEKRMLPKPAARPCDECP